MILIGITDQLKLPDELPGDKKKSYTILSKSWWSFGTGLNIIIKRFFWLIFEGKSQSKNDIKIAFKSCIMRPSILFSIVFRNNFLFFFFNSYAKYSHMWLTFNKTKNNKFDREITNDERQFSLPSVTEICTCKWSKEFYSNKKNKINNTVRSRIDYVGPKRYKGNET